MRDQMFLILALVFKKLNGITQIMLRFPTHANNNFESKQMSALLERPD